MGAASHKQQPLLDAEKGGHGKSRPRRRQKRLGSRRNKDGTLAKLTPAEKMQKYVNVAADRADADAENYKPKCARCLKISAPVFAVVYKGLFWVVRGILLAYTFADESRQKLPNFVGRILQMVVGLTLCFFGGKYITLIAVIEAFRTMGGQRFYSELEHIWNKSQEDISELEKKGKNKSQKGTQPQDQPKVEDSIANMDEEQAKALLKDKAELYLWSVEDPTTLQIAVGSLWSACLGVLGALHVKFVQTVAYALAISEMIGPTVCFLCAPGIQYMLGHELGHWALTIITTVVQVFCVLLVWLLHSAFQVRAALYAGLRGGRLFAVGLIGMLEKKAPHVLEGMPDAHQHNAYKSDESHLDEYIGYTLAAAGFMFQVTSFFCKYHPVADVVLWPVQKVEDALHAYVTFSGHFSGC